MRYYGSLSISRLTGPMKRQGWFVHFCHLSSTLESRISKAPSTLFGDKSRPIRSAQSFTVSLKEPWIKDFSPFRYPIRSWVISSLTPCYSNHSSSKYCRRAGEAWWSRSPPPIFFSPRGSAERSTTSSIPPPSSPPCVYTIRPCACWLQRTGSPCDGTTSSRYLPIQPSVRNIQSTTQIARLSYWVKTSIWRNPLRVCSPSTRYISLPGMCMDAYASG